MNMLSQEAVLSLFSSIDQVTQEAFDQVSKMLNNHLVPLGFKEVREVIGQEYAMYSIVGRAFVSKTRVLFENLRFPDGDIRIQIFQIYDGRTDSTSQALSKFSGYDGFGDFCYAHIEGLQRVHSAKPGTQEYSKEIEDYLKHLLQSRHLDWILRGRFWHNYEFDIREHMIGDFNDEDLRKRLWKSLKDQGLDA